MTRSFSPRHALRPLSALVAAGALVVAAAVVSGAPTSDVVMLASTAVAAGGFFRTAARSEIGRGLRLYGWSALVWLAGMGLWLGLEWSFSTGPDVNPAAGTLLLAGTGLALLGTLNLPGAPASSGARVRMVLDGLLLGTSILFIAWEPLVEPVVSASSRSPESEFALLVFPVVDVTMLVVLAVVGSRTTGGRTMLGLLCGSALARLLGDTFFAYYALDRVGSHGDAVVDMCWALSYTLLALAAIGSSLPAADRLVPSRRPQRGTQQLTYVPVGAAFAVAILVAVGEGRLLGAQLSVLLGLAAMLLIRQWITLDENRQLLREVAFQAEHDPLTGLRNRAGLLRSVSAAVAAGGGVRVYLIDLDRFKDLNDTLGFPVGDALLTAVGNRLAATAGDLPVARMGGDEYAVVDSPHDGAGLAERLLVAVRQPFTAAGRAIHLDASVGISELEVTPGGPVPADPDRVAVDLLRDADSAMHAAKSAGGGIQRFEDDLRRTMLDRVALGRELRDALIRGDELALAYQPVVHLPSGRVLHVEALARWTSPRRGAVPPGVFIPIAESSGLMPLLGRWVLRTACAQTAAWNRQGYDIGVCVNVSAQQLAEAEIVTDVKETLERTGLAADRLMLELTESLFVADSESTWGPLVELREMGVRIAIDDFGTGYSALGYLRRLPVDALKLDRRFVSEMDDTDVAVLDAMLAMARALDLDTIAEGIETGQQCAHLRRLGCELGQGYHLARPMPAGAVPEHLDEPLPRAA